MSKSDNTAVILARVSSKTQEDEGYSLDSQMKLLQGYCQQRELEVVKVFKIAETASKEQSRKVFHELLTHLKTHKIFHLAVEKTDRLTRNFRDAVAVDDWLEQDPRRRLHAVKESLVLHKEARSDVKFMWNIHLSVAKKYSDNLREEAMKGWAEKLAQGWLPCRPPPGYMTISVNGKKIHQPDPTTKLVLQRAFEKYLEPDQTIESIRADLEYMGLRTSAGRPFSKSYTHKVLSNPFYIGINKFNGKQYPGAQEPIIAKDIFDRVQQKMRRKLTCRYRTHNPVFKNVIRCASCGKMVTWQLQKGYYYGGCQRRNTTCKVNVLLREDRLEEIIQGMLASLVSPRPEVIDWLSTAMKERHQESIDSNKQLVASIQMQLDRIKRMDSNLYDDKLAGEISVSEYTKKHQAFTEQRDALEAKMDSIDSTTGRGLEQRLVLLELSQKSADIYKKKSPNQKRIIITKLFEEIKYEGGILSVNYTTFTRAIAQNIQKTHQILGGKI
jgi:site-specific DNA recombinase